MEEREEKLNCTTSKLLCSLRFFAVNFPPVKPLTSYSGKLTDAQAAALRAFLVERNYKFREPRVRHLAELVVALDQKGP